MARHELGRNPRRRARGGVSAAGNSATARVLGRRLRQFLSVCLRVLPGAPVHGIRTERLLFATFLVARKVYENWHWWLVIDSVSLCLSFTRHLYLTTLLFALYLILIVIGMRQWRGTLGAPAHATG
jgi:hypothetical protein